MVIMMLLFSGGVGFVLGVAALTVTTPAEPVPLEPTWEVVVVDDEPVADDRSAAPEAEAPVSRRRRIIEIASALLLALAAVAAAWAGYQSARWGGVQATDTAEASAARLESSRANATAYDSRMKKTHAIFRDNAYSSRRRMMKAIWSTTPETGDSFPYLLAR